MVKGVGTKVFWVQTGGYDTHAGRTRTRPTAPTPALMGDAERRAARVLQRPAEPGAARRHARAAVLGVRPPHQRERQPGTDHGAAERDDGDGRRRRAAASTARRRTSASATDNPTLENSGERRALRDRLPLGLRAGHRLVARAPTRSAILGADFRGGRAGDSLMKRRNGSEGSKDEDHEARLVIFVTS